MTPSTTPTTKPTLPLFFILFLPYISTLLYKSYLTSTYLTLLPPTLLSICAYFLTSYLIPHLSPLHTKAGLYGRDLNKLGTRFGDKQIPEALGLVCGGVYLVVLCALCYFGFWGEGDDGKDVGLVTAAMASVAFMVLLGFADDVLDLKWRYKLVLPLLASLPLLVNYEGGTSVKLPRVVVGIVKGVVGVRGIGVGVVDVGVLYFVYMGLLSVFCTNAINIYAGINGLEAGQSIVIGMFVLMHNVWNMDRNPSLVKDNVEMLFYRHLFSVNLIAPFLGVTCALFVFNKYPSKCFVGDTFCYFAGMTFAMAAILGHYSETLLLLFLPQIVNFLYSTPQLFGLIPCPRHRLPRFDRETGLLYPVKNHLTLINLVLFITGPMTEKNLCNLLLVIQFASCVAGLGLRLFALKVLL